ncbi:Dynamitin-domain-containing protein [Scheffersomyces coipomensis]|uniref:Dynamitin-domain-containing protein n=1 Tax=Scheffersomyces coipomensis TaxID=1788519 RepID=UPI00315D8964
MQKYSDLPDIEQDSQELFETSDNDSVIDLSLSKDDVINVKDDDIVEESLNANFAKEKFPQTTISEHGKIDFSGSISNKAFGQTGYVLISGEEESRNEKIARIARELEELKSDPASSSTESQQLDRLTELLESNTNATVGDYNDEKFQSVFNAISEKVKVDESISNTISESTSLVDTSEILELEARLAKVESFVGYDSIIEIQHLEQTSERRQSLSAKINDLRLKIGIVNNPQYNISNIKDELSTLRLDIAKYDNERKLHEVKVNTILETPAARVDEKQINELYQKLPEFDKINKIVPMVVNRLKSLNAVHSDIGNTVHVVSHLDEILNDIKSDLKTWNESINTVNANLDAYASNFIKNEQEIVSQLNRLDTKVNDL